MQIENSNVIFYIIGIIVLFIFGRIFVGSMKFVSKFVYSTILGGIVILVINFVGKVFSFYIALNPVTAFIVGALGIPGIGLIVALKNILSIWIYLPKDFLRIRLRISGVYQSYSI